MATTAAIVVALRAKSSEFRKGMNEGKAALKEFREDAKRTQEYAKNLESGNKGIIGSFKSLKTAAATIGLELVGRSLANVTGAIKEMSIALRDGTANWADFTSNILESMPIIGGFAKAGRNIGEMFVPIEETAAGAKALAAERAARDQRDLDASNAAKKLRDEKAAKAKAEAEAKFQKGEGITGSLRQQLVGVMGEGAALEFQLNDAQANTAQRAIAADLQNQIRSWEKRNAEVAEAKSITEGLIDSVRQATMSEREYTIAKLRSNGATISQINLAKNSMDVLKADSLLKAAKGDLDMSGGGSIAALQKGSVEAFSADRRNAAGVAKTVSTLEKIAKLETDLNATMIRQERLLQTISGKQGTDNTVSILP